MASPVTYLLDTNILVLLIRGKAAGLAIAAAFGLRTGLTRCLISVVTVGEMRALARKFNWGPQKVADLDKLLAQVVWIDINHPDILGAYAELDDLSERAGRSMGKNDVWIAATTKVVGATLLTTDADFDHLHPAQITRIRLDQNTGVVVP
jgi:tRNA(fMet)-specific endonuclease VapC